MIQAPDRPRGRQAQPAPAARPPTPYRPADVIRDLVTLLRGHGLAHLYWSASTQAGVLSVTYGLTVWCLGRHLTWTYADASATWPADDIHGAAGRLAQLARQSSQP